MNLAGNRKAVGIAGFLTVWATLVGFDVGAQLRAVVPPACVPPSGGPSGPPELKPTTITTIGQAYYCIIDNYYSGSVLDDRSLLVPAFAALTQELQRRRLDQAGASLPALTGRTDQDWAAFSHVYEQITARLPQNPAVRQAVAEATMHGMVASLNDNHAMWARGRILNLIGITLNAQVGPGHLDPVASEPLFIRQVSGPAESAGIRMGDELLAVNGVPPSVNGVVSVGVLRWITHASPDTPVQLTVHRPATEATFTVTVTPAESQPPPTRDESKLVNGNIAYVKMPNFGPRSADRVLTVIAELRNITSLRGVILDLRGNGGGSPEERARLLGAWVHGKITNYWCDANDRCTEGRTDDSVPLLGLRLVTLIDRYCASACDSFVSAVKDLRLGTLVGTRTAGAVSGPGQPYLLDDGSAIVLPKYHERAANGEIVNTIGVPPDYFAPLTAPDLSTGRDPGLTKAVELLR
jgi:carboxyl-terminal processing protease